MHLSIRFLFVSVIIAGVASCSNKSRDEVIDPVAWLDSLLNMNALEYERRCDLRSTLDTIDQEFFSLTKHEFQRFRNRELDSTIAMRFYSHQYSGRLACLSMPVTWWYLVEVMLDSLYPNHSFRQSFKRIGHERFNAGQVTREDVHEVLDQVQATVFPNSSVERIVLSWAYMFDYGEAEQYYLTNPDEAEILLIAPHEPPFYGSTLEFEKATSGMDTVVVSTTYTKGEILMGFRDMFNDENADPYRDDSLEYPGQVCCKIVVKRADGRQVRYLLDDRLSQDSGASFITALYSTYTPLNVVSEDIWGDGRNSCFPYP